MFCVQSVSTGWIQVGGGDEVVRRCSGEERRWRGRGEEGKWGGGQGGVRRYIVGKGEWSEEVQWGGGVSSALKFVL